MTRFALTLLCALVAAPLAADSTITRNYVIAENAPYMHHSCASVIEAHGTDEDQMLFIVRHMVMLSLMNRAIDVEGIDLTDAQRETLRDDFIAALGAYCRADPDMLLAAAIDLSVLSLAE